MVFSIVFSRSNELAGSRNRGRSHAGFSSQHFRDAPERGLSRRFGVIEALTFKRIECAGRSKEFETASVANDNTCLKCNAYGRRSDLDDVIVEHRAPPAAGSRRRPELSDD
jgi:hypothetical protein